MSLNSSAFVLCMRASDCEGAKKRPAPRVDARRASERGSERDAIGTILVEQEVMARAHLLLPQVQYSDRQVRNGFLRLLRRAEE